MFFRPDLEAVDIHDERGEQSKRCQVRKECDPPKQNQHDKTKYIVFRVYL